MSAGETSLLNLIELEAFEPIDSYLLSAGAAVGSDETRAIEALSSDTTRRLRQHWTEVYGEGNFAAIFDAFVRKLSHWRAAAAASTSSTLPFTPTSSPSSPESSPSIHETAVIYSMYVDSFAAGFDAAIERLAHLESLGIDCVWLLPVLDSPMLDAGFDIRDYRAIRKELGGNEAFDRFLAAAHARGIAVLFDVAINHCSAEHRWFTSAVANRDSPYRDFFLWSNDARGFERARVIFRGIESSNWAASNHEFYFHRFFAHQPDLNYRNPAVLLSILSTLLLWALHGVDGFRLDAAPCLWKEEGTDCESRPQVHSIIKFVRAALDALRPRTFLLAEACQASRDVAAYFGAGDECHAAYHFPLMPALFLALARQRPAPIVDVLRDLPALPRGCQWFTFLRVHDEMTLEMASAEQRDELMRAYCREPAWDFRQGLGVSARLADLLGNDARRILLAFNIELTLVGAPLIYYGDEVARRNDVAFYEAERARTGLNDTRYLVRGPLDWRLIEQQLTHEPTSTAAVVFNGLRELLARRRRYTELFARGTLEFVEAASPHVLAYRRAYNGRSLLLRHNLNEPFDSQWVDE